MGPFFTAKMNSTSCKSCFRVSNQVKLQGNDLILKIASQLYNVIKETPPPPVDLLHVAKHDSSSVAFLHFSDHVTGSVFYNTHDSMGLNINGFVRTLKATNKNGIVIAYSQVDIVRFLHTYRPLTIIQLEKFKECVNPRPFQRAKHLVVPRHGVLR
ncbi:hypothetical protein EDC94DRAFT_572479 [Helicostylum pulchrum]|nr:hypothetical protein EDC94DRAFT_572479 [Helicostylum pulchrum]